MENTGEYDEQITQDMIEKALRTISYLAGSERYNNLSEREQEAIGIMAEALGRERDTGTWLLSDTNGKYHICSQCANPIKDMPTCMGEPLYRWCPCCGSRMVNK